MSDNGYIRLHRKITQWEWYQNPNTFRVFLHCLLMANFTDGRFEGKEVKRGQFVTSLPSLAKQTSLTIQQVRTSLAHLISTGEITDRSTRHYRVITIVKYNEYQQDNRQNNRQSTDNQQTVNRQSTDNQQQYKKNKNNKNDKKEKNIKRIPSVFTQPSVGEVEDYCRERNNGINGQEFVDFYESKGWMIGKNKMKDWKAAVRTWERNRKSRPVVQKADARDVHGYEQRDYSSEQSAAIARMMNDGWGDES